MNIYGNSSSRQNLDVSGNCIAFNIFFLALLFLFILQIHGCASMRATQNFINGENYMEERQYDQAISEYSKAIDIDPELADAYKGRSIAYMKSSKFENALKDIDKACQLKPSNPEVLYFHGLINMSFGHYETALSDFTKCIEIVDTSPTRILKKGKSRKGTYYYSTHVFTTPLPYYDRSYIHFMRKEYDKALSDINNAIRRNHPNLAGAYSIQGRIWLEKKQYEKGISAFNRVIEINSKDCRTYYLKAIACEHAAHTKAAIESYKLFLKCVPSKTAGKQIDSAKQRIKYLEVRQ